MNSSSFSLGDETALKCEMAGEVLRSSGVLRLGVTGWSMIPAVWPGDVLHIERIPGNAVSEGDIILFGRDRRLFAHRVVASGEPKTGAILTRGDAMPAADPCVHETDVLGRVCLILRNGKRILPGRSLRFSERALAVLVQHSYLAVRVIVFIHGMRLTEEQSQFQMSRV